MNAWLYRVRVWNRSRSRYVEVRKYMTPTEYERPEWRTYYEEKAEEELRHVEGITDEMKRERFGWVYEAFDDGEQSDDTNHE